MAAINSVGNSLTGLTGTGTFVGANTPTLITPNIGAATGTSLTTTSNIVATGGFIVSGSASGGVVGEMAMYSTTASKGFIDMQCIDNAGNFGITIRNASFGQASILTYPDPGAASASFLLTNSASAKTLNYQLIAPSFSPNTTSGIIGTTTNDNAAAGSVGEISSSANATSVAMTTATVTQIQTLTLGAGDWDVWATFYATVNAATVVTSVICQLFTSSASIGLPNTAQLSSIQNWNGTQTGNTTYMNTGMSRWSLSGSTTVYLNASATYSVNTLVGNGMIHARRRR